MGYFFLKEKKLLPLRTGTGSWKLQQFKSNKDYFLEGMYDGFFLYKNKGGALFPIGKIEGFDESSRFFSIDAKDNIWVSSPYSGLFKISISFENKTIKEIKKVSTKNGLRSDYNVFVFSWQGKPLIANERHFMYPKELSSNTLIQKELEDLETDEIIYHISIYNGILYLITNKKFRTYFLDFLGKLSPFLLPKNTFIYNNLVETFYTVNKHNEKVIVGTRNGFIFYNPKTNTETINTFLPPSIYSVSTTSKYTKKDTLLNILNASKETPLKIYNMKNIRFSFSSPNGNILEKKEYQYRIQGISDTWSEWSKENVKEFTSLPEGEYVFELRSRIEGGKTSPSGILHFSISPHYLLSNKAKTFYSFLSFFILILGYIFIKKRHSTEKKSIIGKNKVELEKKAREIESISIETEEKIGKIKEEQYKTELDFLENKLQMKTMNMVQKNTLLSTVEKELMEALKTMKSDTAIKIISETISKIRESSNSSKVWEDFQDSFQQVHHGFSERILSTHKNLSPNDLRLCILLRANLTTKEIADLLNISPRGVEIARYRIRKKINLPRTENLTRYILSI